MHKQTSLKHSSIATAIAAILGSTLMAAPVFAQDDTAKLEEITVTGSRIRMTNGMETSNPVTVVTMDEISLTSPGSLVDGLAELPQFSGSNTTANPGSFFNNPTTGSLSLRGLQGKRTLTLLSGRRVVPSTMNSGPDINLFPEAMLRSVETVTGGATAAYGTDAVSGAVNFILDTDFTGYKASVQAGQNYNQDNDNVEVSLAGGWELNDRSNLMLSVEKYDQNAVVGREGYDWYKGRGLLRNPSATAGQTPENPIFLPYDNLVSRNTSLNSVITFPAAAQGVWEVSENGTATPFVTSSAFDANFHSITNGGSGMDNGAERPQLQNETGRENFFGYADYDVTDNLKVFGQLIYGENTLSANGSGGVFGSTRAFTIFSGNPYLPANIQQLMTANNVASVKVGRIGSIEDVAAGAINSSDTEMTSLTGGFNLSIDSTGFFQDWAVDGYFQKGKTDSENAQDGGIRVDRIYLAADAVRDTNGNIVCNVTKVSGLYPDCKPFNPFGRGNASAASVDWVTGFDPGIAVNTNGWLPNGESIPYSYTGTSAKKRILEMEQDVFELSANGEVFDGFGAGAVAMALGYAWRSESFVQYVQSPQGNVTTDPDFRPVAANNAAKGIRGVVVTDATNSTAIQFSKVGFGVGSFLVREAFAEFNIPLLADLPFIDQMDANVATRWANYSGSGDVWSWKGGLEWRMNDEIRLRGTVSQDVRAATMGERFDRTGGAATIIDYLEDPTGATQYSSVSISGGNPNVKPEEAKTFTAGVVYQPTFLDGLQVSLDWYNVEVKDNINLLGVTTIMRNCYQGGDVDACALIERDAAPGPNTPAIPRVSIVNDVYVNVNAVEAEGVDFEVSYLTDLNVFGGGESLRLRLLGSNLIANNSTNSVGLVTENKERYGLPEWNSTISATYTRGGFMANLQARHESSTQISLFNNVYQTSLGRVRYDVLDNKIESQVLLDGRLSYAWDTKGGRINTFLAVNNIMNEDPLESLAAPDSVLSMAPGNGVVGSLLGRRYTVGANLDF